MPMVNMSNKYFNTMASKPVRSLAKAAPMQNVV
jgi:hypothetical protein